MSALNRQCLVLNASYEAIQICSARKALTLLFKGAAIVEHISPHVVRTAKINVPVPSVIRLIRYRRVPRINRSVSRKGIILRDGSTCQYCRDKLSPKSLTMDHVIPKARGGESTWENLVACCFSCNNKKASRTPQEAGMVLIKIPRQVSIHSRHRLLAGDDGSWDKYLFC